MKQQERVNIDDLSKRFDSQFHHFRAKVKSKKKNQKHMIDKLFLLNLFIFIVFVFRIDFA